MQIPTATYRIQFNAQFNFEALRAQLGYLHKLGISTIYASPITKPREGSHHGYDVIDSLQLNPQLGNEEALQQLAADLRHYSMSWLQDIVPNHEAFDSGNPYLMDVFEKGPYSPFYHYFDINWEYNDPEFQGKVMTPFLGGELKKCIKNGELYLIVNDHGIFLKYYEMEFPLSIFAYRDILKKTIDQMTLNTDQDDPLLQKLTDLLDTTGNITGTPPFQFDNAKWDQQKAELFNNYDDHTNFADSLEEVLNEYNTNPDQLQLLVDRQYYRPVYWERANEQINYRRFFTISDLICLRMGDKPVFDHYHGYLVKLFHEGIFQGLRIDHIDGLFNPKQYLHWIRATFGNNLYLIGEKILEQDETLPLDWPVQGTTGYDFLALVNQLFTQPAHYKAFTSHYQEVVNDKISGNEAMLRNKKFILDNRMEGELTNLMALMEETNLLPAEYLPTEAKNKVREALSLFLAAFPVYRIYPDEIPLENPDLEILKQTLENAESQAPELSGELTYIYELLSGSNRPQGATKADQLFFLMRCQQFTGPLAAKGVEDTTFYTYNRLIANNEVGDHVENFGLSNEEFHQAMIDRRENWPHTMNTTATHDTKRGEDARLRINVLSELPDEWRTKVERWMEMNKQHKQAQNGIWAPDPNDEYFLYQTLIGTCPAGQEPDQKFRERIRKYMTKVAREAKQNSSWLAPNMAYEEALTAFVDQVLDPRSEFWQDFQPFMEKMAHYGQIYSLGQLLIKLTAPGVPDIYQGGELWDLNLVDPDNRRPVNYPLRAKYLDEIMETTHSELPSYLEKLLKASNTGQIKLFTLYKALTLRNSYDQLFRHGDYKPLQVTGSKADHLIAFARKYGDDWAITAVPRFLYTQVEKGELPCGEEFWGDTRITFNDQFPGNWHNALTAESITEQEGLPCAEIFKRFPVGLLYGV